jgi:hypothetical protein
MDAILETLEVAAITAQKEVIPEEWRVRLLSAASNLVTALQRPEETVMRESFWVCDGYSNLAMWSDTVPDGSIHGRTGPARPECLRSHYREG